MYDNAEARLVPKWFVDEAYPSHSRETDYVLGTYGSEKPVWLGDDMMLEEAMTRTEELAGRRSNSEY